MSVPIIIAEFTILSDARECMDLKRADGGEYHVTAGVNHRWAVTAMCKSRSTYEIPHINFGQRQVN